MFLGIPIKHIKKTETENLILVNVYGQNKGEFKNYL